MIWILLLIGGLYGSYIWFLPKTEIISLHSPKPSFTPYTGEPYAFTTPPSQSMNASIIRAQGEVSFQSRIATEPASLNVIEVRQGESLITGENGSIEIQFPSSISALMSSQSHMNLIQTLPHAVIFEQTSGSVRYANPTDIPLVIRIKRLLVSGAKAIISVTYDETRDSITVTSASGSATLAFNDASFVSQVETIQSGKSVTFNNQKRKLFTY